MFILILVMSSCLHAKDEFHSLKCFRRSSSRFLGMFVLTSILTYGLEGSKDLSFIFLFSCFQNCVYFLFNCYGFPRVSKDFIEYVQQFLASF